jgi:hypothetical protein
MLKCLILMCCDKNPRMSENERIFRFWNFPQYIKFVELFDLQLKRQQNTLFTEFKHISVYSRYLGARGGGYISEQLYLELCI